MDHDHGSSQDTPYNINIPYAGALAGVLAGLTVLLAIRHFVFSWNTSRNSGYVKAYNRCERFIVNKFSYTLNGRRSGPWLPPIGLILIIIMLLSTALPLLLVDVNLSINSNRAGFLVLALVPFVLASTGKNSAMALVTGISPVKLNYLHRILATAIVVLATIHMAPMLKSWSRFPAFMQSKLETEKVQYGLGGYGCLCLVFLGSLGPVRRFFYEGFLVSHLLAFGFMGAVAKHTPYAMRYFFAGFVCYAVNVLTGWFVKSRVARARFDVLPNGCTRISLRLSSPLLHRPGQYIYVNLPALSYFQWHPFTITNTRMAADSACDMVEVHACVRGNFTKKLYERAQHGQEWTAFISGPCGNGSIDLEPTTMLSSHKSILLLGAGAGVTFPIRLLRDLAYTLFELPLTRDYITQEIYFCWSVRHAGELEWFRQELERLLVVFENARRSESRIPRLTVNLYVTSSDGDAAINEKVDDEEQHQNEGNVMLQATSDESAKPAMYLNTRIKTKALLKSLHDRSPGVFVCGPSGFNAQAKNAVAGRTSIGSGPHLHCEAFEY
ncbi:ferric reductase NAD binding domain-containing protein [Zychaea mexicana]|uniref:ferric reductase NAD binding domain-containing protein n=1 Tax=Zychaea mexicana TaxID=64656 RepID=UPI0022FDB6F6|nr:ferric reductase NAD binding domain-containing protein [Zychaea mexicana]KAI9497664.1 ferric reductase NAD binding domain-containing protein [Zychaea mexicana]